MKRPHKKLKAWLASECLSVGEAARSLGCSRPLLSMIVNGHRKPGRRVANMIERLTAPWIDGPIRAAEWDHA